MDVDPSRAQESRIPLIKDLPKATWLHILSLIRDFEFKLTYDAKKSKEEPQDEDSHEIKDLLEDTRFHDECADELWNVLKNLDKLTKNALINLIKSRWWIIRKPRQKQVISEIESNFPKVKKSLAYLLDESIDFEERYDALNNPNDPLHIYGFGAYQASQLLAALDKEEYMVFEDSVICAMSELGLIEKSLTKAPRRGHRYLYLNKICKALMDKFIFINQFVSSLAVVHNFFWHYYRCYRLTRDWMICPRRPVRQEA